MAPTEAQRVATAVASGLIGLMIGSFLNVVIYRVPRSMSVVRPRSKCPGCGTTLSAADNVPVLSWLVLRGRCRTCAMAISARYPAIELSCALAFAGLGAGFGPRASLLGTMVVAATTLAAAAIASDGLALPPVLNGVGLVGAAALAAVAGADHELARIGWAAAGAGVGGATWLVLARPTNRPALWQPGLPFAIAGWCIGWAWRYGLVALAIAVAAAWIGSSVFVSSHRRALTDQAEIVRQQSIALAGALGATVVLLVVGAIVSGP